MDDELFDELLLSIKQAGQIHRGEMPPSRVFEHEEIDVKSLRKHYQLTQLKFAALMGISLGTLQNWEQGRRTPKGPARRLLQVAQKHPEILLSL